MQFNYTYNLVPEDDDRLGIEFPGIPEIVTSVSADEHRSGKTMIVALDALKNALQARVDFFDDLPDSNGTEGEYRVALSPVTIFKLVLFEELKRRGIARSGIAEALDTTATNASRLMSLFHETRSEQLLAACSKLGVTPEIAVRLKRI